MKTIKAFIKSYPVLSYFVLAFAISWGGMLLIIGGAGTIPGTAEETTKLFPAVYLERFSRWLTGQPVTTV